MRKTICFIFLLYLSFSWEFQRQQLFQQPSSNQQEYWFTQILDHSNYLHTKTWQQRYYILDDYYQPETGPILLYICGEAECRGIPNPSFTTEIAQSTRGLVVALEHRYYGKSRPFGNSSFTKQNLVYLSSQQALSDLANFIVQMSRSELFKINEKSPWISIGGSYPGALSAWFRSKYPHLTIGAISSSGVILAVENFRQFDEQIYTSSHKSGDFCPQAIVALSDYVEQQVTSDNKQAFKTQFGAENLTARQFLFYWSDVIVFQMQYGSRTTFCSQMKGKTLEEQFNYAKQLVLKVSPYEYGAYYLKDPQFELDHGVGARPWYYQCCTEYSYFQTYAAQHPMRSRMLSIDFYRKWCEDIFGLGTWAYVNRVNNQFGGLDIKATNLIMTNGDEDPWQWASMRKSTNKDIYCKVITCDNCAHCVDLHASKASDAKDLTNTRQHELQSVQKWIQDYWKHKNGDL